MNQEARNKKYHMIPFLPSLTTGKTKICVRSQDSSDLWVGKGVMIKGDHEQNL